MSTTKHRLELRARGLDSRGTKEQVEQRLLAAIKREQGIYEESRPVVYDDGDSNHSSDLMDTRSDGMQDVQPRLYRQNLQQRLGERSMIPDRVPGATRLSVHTRLGKRKAFDESDYAVEEEEPPTRQWVTKCDFIPFSKEPISHQFKEYDIAKMEERAEKFSDVELLKKRTRRFDEEVAPELANVRDAKFKNLRFKRFKLDNEESENEEEEED